MVGILLATGAVGVGSALLPLVGIELFVLGLMAAHPTLPCLAIGAAAATGQILGKLVYFLAARGDLRLPARLRHRDRPPSPGRERWRLRTKRLRRLLDAVRERCVRHRGWMLGSYATSAVVGLPPLMATTVVAGLARMSPGAFLAVGVLGRTIRFTALAAAPVLVTGWLS